MIANFYQIYFLKKVNMFELLSRSPCSHRKLGARRMQSNMFELLNRSPCSQRKKTHVRGGGQSNYQNF